MPQLRTADTRHILISSWIDKGVRDMAAWYSDRTMGWSGKMVIAAVVLAVLLVAAVPVAFVAWRCSAPRSWRPSLAL
jgi:hypothetical protein